MPLKINRAVYHWGIYPVWLLLTASVFFRHAIPVDETRYLSVAWEMWLRNDFLVPYLNGHWYSHKPPLLFWLFQLGWAVFGVNDVWPKLVGPLCALLNLLLTRKLASKLWPARPEIALLAPWILIATALWTLFATSAMFDIPLTCLVLLGLIGIVQLSENLRILAFVNIALAIGLGLLTKGPVIFVHLLPTALAISLWSKSAKPKAWYRLLAVANLLGIAIALAWAIPAAIDGGTEYANAIFWRQTAERASMGTEIHAHPVFWYLLFLPLLLFPWFFSPLLWQKTWLKPIINDHPSRFCLIWFFADLVIFSLLPSKQIHYIIPMLPAFACILAKVYCDFDVKKTSSGLAFPLAYAVVGIILMLIPYIPGLSQFNWAQSIQYGWGLSVLLIALIMAGMVIYQKSLSLIVASTSLVLSVFIGFIFFFAYTGLAYNLEPAALQVKQLHDQGIACAFVGNYQGQFNFIGRLQQPLTTIDSDQTEAWVAKNPQGVLIDIERYKPEQASYLQAHREYWLVFRPASAVHSLKAL